MGCSDQVGSFTSATVWSALEIAAKVHRGPSLGTSFFTYGATEDDTNVLSWLLEDLSPLVEVGIIFRVVGQKDLVLALVVAAGLLRRRRIHVLGELPTLSRRVSFAEMTTTPQHFFSITHLTL